MRAFVPGAGRGCSKLSTRITFDGQGRFARLRHDQSLQDHDLKVQFPGNSISHGIDLQLLEEPPRHGMPIQNNPAGLRMGYDPYESGLLPRRPKRKKIDLRELSRWLELKRRIGSKPSDT